MRVIECNECGETISAATDDELVRRLGSHLASEHDLEPGREELGGLVREQSYDATDS